MATSCWGHHNQNGLQKTTKMEKKKKKKTKRVSKKPTFACSIGMIKPLSQEAYNCRFYLQFMHIWAPKTNVTFPPWENEKLVHHRWPLVSCQISLTIQQQKFELFYGERQCESMASCPKNATHNTTQTKERSLDLKSSVSHNLYSTLPCPTGYL